MGRKAKNPTFWYTCPMCWLRCALLWLTNNGKELNPPRCSHCLRKEPR